MNRRVLPLFIILFSCEKAGRDPNMIGTRGEENTCAGAAATSSYLGCEFWPTVTFNPVWTNNFDFTVVVSNPSTSQTGEHFADPDPTKIVVDGPNNFHQEYSMKTGEILKISLPWVTALKGPDFDACTTITAPKESVKLAGAAYHLTASRPVVAYQFSPLQYVGHGDDCPGEVLECSPSTHMKSGCFSFSNDASLLLPTTALTGNYRLMGIPGQMFPQGDIPSFVAITGTANGTTVTLKLNWQTSVIGGATVNAIPSGGVERSFALDAGEVLELLADKKSDFSGSVIKADRPVQVITGHPCAIIPSGKPACDHIEETVFPAETLGKHYVVNAPTGPLGNVVGQYVRLYGNVDDTKLTFSPPLMNAPETLSAGEVVALGVVDKNFEVTGTQAFGVGMFQLGGSVVDPKDINNSKGDPDESFAVPVDQYRKGYLFLAPSDYDISFADVVMPAGTELTLDDFPVTEQPATLNDFQIVRVKLVGNEGVHRLIANQPVGIQVVGYGRYTSYQYPGGLDLTAISAPPIF